MASRPPNLVESAANHSPESPHEQGRSVSSSSSSSTSTTTRRTCICVPLSSTSCVTDLYHLIWEASNSQSSKFVAANRRGLASSLYIPHTIVFSKNRETQWYYTGLDGSIKQQPGALVNRETVYRTLTGIPLPKTLSSSMGRTENKNHLLSASSSSPLLSDWKYSVASSVPALSDGLMSHQQANAQSATGNLTGDGASSSSSSSSLSSSPSSLSSSACGIVAQFVYANAGEDEDRNSERDVSASSANIAQQRPIAYLTRQSLAAFLTQVNADFNTPLCHGILQQFIVPQASIHGTRQDTSTAAIAASASAMDGNNSDAAVTIATSYNRNDNQQQQQQQPHLLQGTRNTIFRVVWDKRRPELFSSTFSTSSSSSSSSSFSFSSTSASTRAHTRSACGASSLALMYDPTVSVTAARLLHQQLQMEHTAAHKQQQQQQRQQQYRNTDSLSPAAGCQNPLLYALSTLERLTVPRALVRAFAEHQATHAGREARASTLGKTLLTDSSTSSTSSTSYTATVRHVPSALAYRLEWAVCNIAEHLCNAPKVGATSWTDLDLLDAVIKVGADDRLWLLWCPALRVVSNDTPSSTSTSTSSSSTSSSSTSSVCWSCGSVMHPQTVAYESKQLQALIQSAAPPPSSHTHTGSMSSSSSSSTSSSSSSSSVDHARPHSPHALLTKAAHSVSLRPDSAERTARSGRPGTLRPLSGHATAPAPFRTGAVHQASNETGAAATSTKPPLSSSSSLHTPSASAASVAAAAAASAAVRRGVVSESSGPALERVLAALEALTHNHWAAPGALGASPAREHASTGVNAGPTAHLSSRGSGLLTPSSSASSASSSTTQLHRSAAPSYARPVTHRPPKVPLQTVDTFINRPASAGPSKGRTVATVAAAAGSGGSQPSHTYPPAAHTRGHQTHMHAWGPDVRHHHMYQQQQQQSMNQPPHHRPAISSAAPSASSYPPPSLPHPHSHPTPGTPPPSTLPYGSSSLSTLTPASQEAGSVPSVLATSAEPTSEPPAPAEPVGLSSLPPPPAPPGEGEDESAYWRAVEQWQRAVAAHPLGATILAMVPSSANANAGTGMSKDRNGNDDDEKAAHGDSDGRVDDGDDDDDDYAHEEYDDGRAHHDDAAALSSTTQGSGSTYAMATQQQQHQLPRQPTRPSTAGQQSKTLRNGSGRSCLSRERRRRQRQQQQGALSGRSRLLQYIPPLTPFEKKKIEAMAKGLPVPLLTSDPLRSEAERRHRVFEKHTSRPLQQRPHPMHRAYPCPSPAFALPSAPPRLTAAFAAPALAVGVNDDDDADANAQPPASPPHHPHLSPPPRPVKSQARPASAHVVTLRRRHTQDARAKNGTATAAASASSSASSTTWEGATQKPASFSSSSSSSSTSSSSQHSASHASLNIGTSNCAAPTESQQHQQQFHNPHPPSGLALSPSPSSLFSSSSSSSSATSSFNAFRPPRRVTSYGHARVPQASLKQEMLNNAAAAAAAAAVATSSASSLGSHASSSSSSLTTNGETLCSDTATATTLLAHTPTAASASASASAVPAPSVAFHPPSQVYLSPSSSIWEERDTDLTVTDSKDGSEASPALAPTVAHQTNNISTPSGVLAGAPPSPAPLSSPSPPPPPPPSHLTPASPTLQHVPSSTIHQMMQPDEHPLASLPTTTAQKDYGEAHNAQADPNANAHAVPISAAATPVRNAASAATEEHIHSSDPVLGQSSFLHHGPVHVHLSTNGEHARAAEDTHNPANNQRGARTAAAATAEEEESGLSTASSVVDVMNGPLLQSLTAPWSRKSAPSTPSAGAAPPPEYSRAMRQGTVSSQGTTRINRSSAGPSAVGVARSLAAAHDALTSHAAATSTNPHTTSTAANTSDSRGHQTQQDKSSDLAPSLTSDMNSSAMASMQPHRALTEEEVQDEEEGMVVVVVRDSTGRSPQPLHRHERGERWLHASNRSPGPGQTYTHHSPHQALQQQQQQQPQPHVSSTNASLLASHGSGAGDGGDGGGGMSGQATAASLSSPHRNSLRSSISSKRSSIPSISDRGGGFGDFFRPSSAVAASVGGRRGTRRSARAGGGGPGRGGLLSSSVSVTSADDHLNDGHLVDRGITPLLEHHSDRGASPAYFNAVPSDAHSDHHHHHHPHSNTASSAAGGSMGDSGGVKSVGGSVSSSFQPRRLATSDHRATGKRRTIDSGASRLSHDPVHSHSHMHSGGYGATPHPITSSAGRKASPSPVPSPPRGATTSLSPRTSPSAAGGNHAASRNGSPHRANGPVATVATVVAPTPVPTSNTPATVAAAAVAEGAGQDESTHTLVATTPAVSHSYNSHNAQGPIVASTVRPLLPQQHGGGADRGGANSHIAHRSIVHMGGGLSDGASSTTSSRFDYSTSDSVKTENAGLWRPGTRTKLKRQSSSNNNNNNIHYNASSNPQTTPTMGNSNRVLQGTTRTQLQIQQQQQTADQKNGTNVNVTNDGPQAAAATATVAAAATAAVPSLLQRPSSLRKVRARHSGGEGTSSSFIVDGHGDYTGARSSWSSTSSHSTTASAPAAMMSAATSAAAMARAQQQCQLQQQQKGEAAVYDSAGALAPPDTSAHNSPPDGSGVVGDSDVHNREMDGFGNNETSPISASASASAALPLVLSSSSKVFSSSAALAAGIEVHHTGAPPSYIRLPCLDTLAESVSGSAPPTPTRGSVSSQHTGAVASKERGRGSGSDESQDFSQQQRAVNPLAFAPLRDENESVVDSKEGSTAAAPASCRGSFVYDEARSESSNVTAIAALGGHDAPPFFTTLLSPQGSTVLHDMSINDSLFLNDSLGPGLQTPSRVSLKELHARNRLQHLYASASASSGGQSSSSTVRSIRHRDYQQQQRQQQGDISSAFSAPVPSPPLPLPPLSASSSGSVMSSFQHASYRPGLATVDPSEVSHSTASLLQPSVGVLSIYGGDGDDRTDITGDDGGMHIGGGMRRGPPSQYDMYVSAAGSDIFPDRDNFGVSKSQHHHSQQHNQQQVVISPISAAASAYSFSQPAPPPRPAPLAVPRIHDAQAHGHVASPRSPLSQ